jgi:hypothetical protein
LLGQILGHIQRPEWHSISRIGGKRKWVHIGDPG